MAYDYKKVFAAASLGMLLFGMVMISLGSLLPTLSKRISLSEVETGASLSLLPLGILLGSLIFGPLVDRFGYMAILAIGGVLTFLGFQGLGVATQSPHLNWAITTIGFGGGILNGATNALVSDISTDKHSANLSILGVFYGIGALGMPALLGLLERYFEVGQLIFWMGMGMLLPVFYFMSLRYPKAKRPHGFPMGRALGLLKDPLLLSLGFVLFFQSGVEGLANNWTTTYLESEKGFGPSEALFTLSLFGAGLCLARLLLGQLLRKWDPYTVLLLSMYLLVGAGLLIWSFQGQWPTVIGLVLFGIGLAAGFPVVLGFVGKMYRDMTGTAFSLVISMALVGNVLGNYLMGWVAQELGLHLLPVALIVLVAVMGGLLLGLGKRIEQYTN